MYEHKENNRISNVYTYKLVNKTSKDIDSVQFRLLSHEGTITVVSHEVFTVPARGLAEGTLFVEVKLSSLSGDKDRIKIGVYNGDELIETTATSFLGPRSFK